MNSIIEVKIFYIDFIFFYFKSIQFVLLLVPNSIDISSTFENGYPFTYSIDD